MLRIGAMKSSLHQALAIAALTASLIGPATQCCANEGGLTAEAATPLEIPGQQPPTAQAQPELSPLPVPSPDLADPAVDGMPEDGDSPSASDVSIGEIPTIEIMELTPDIARRALDSYIAAKDKYADADFEQFENLEDFVDQSADGKNFASDVHAAGFATVSDWNLAVTTLGLTYSSVIDDQSADLMLQIEEIEGDDQLAQDMKDKMIKALRALIPSANNKKIVEEMMADPVYGERLKQLDIEEE
jgi:hypothetical protein